MQNVGEWMSGGYWTGKPIPGKNNNASRVTMNHGSLAAAN
uniref:Endonuclease n=1 Tax=Salmonella dublin TaxID=98360 RepID=F5BQP7_SALDU|nr:endonuclease [Salmonella enterica subsp. enterica serovar Dublin]